ncbi:SDR family oxidoreductase [uncultured Desulfosarcina sp.]|uniref:SDR family oxidoreductase n=1 Tax=uncultured Desulfosarcina sp. TaxID=218289 RepID=UPI0029C8EB8E|nr:SDR family oxidoreductase [uncultured Desulfosarcina sp.]
MNGEEKVVAITGASSGIGEATGRLLAGRGARVLLGARRMDRLETIRGAIQSTGGVAQIHPLDVTRRKSVEDFVKHAKQTFGRIDVMVNNAGIMPLSPMSQLKVDEWERMVDVNIKGVLYGIAAALPFFTEQGAGHFVNVSSVAGKVVFPGSAVYSGTKFAVRAISEGLRMENLPGIRSTVIFPGIVVTELANSITDEQMARNIRERRDAFAISPDAIARAVAFAIEQPDDVDVNEIVVRPIKQDR